MRTNRCFAFLEKPYRLSTARRLLSPDIYPEKRKFGFITTRNIRPLADLFTLSLFFYRVRWLKLIS